MFGFQVWHNSVNSKCLVACVDSLGEPRRLTVIDKCKLELVTDEGSWILDRRAFEPAFDLCGFVGVELPAREDMMALYFNLRIIAALVKAKIRWAFTDEKFKFVKGVEIPLYSERQSLEIIREEMAGDFWSLGIVASMVTWACIDGGPVKTEPGSDTDPIIGIGDEPSRLAVLDTNLWLLCMLMKPDENEQRNNLDCDYRIKRMNMFLTARFAQRQALEDLLHHVENWRK